jgi:hypothetical protein
MKYLITKIKYLITIAILCTITMMVSGTMWENQMPDFLQIGIQFQFNAPIFKPSGLSPFEIIKAPYFPLLGKGFYTSAAPLQSTTQKPTETINISRKVNVVPPLTDFSGNFENNLKYAESKSSLRIGQGSSSATFSTPWMIK